MGNRGPSASAQIDLAESESQSTISLRHLRCNSCRWWLEISDTGMGVHPDIADSLFTKYSALQHSATEKSTGLGLAGCVSVNRLSG